MSDLEREVEEVNTSWLLIAFGCFFGIGVLLGMLIMKPFPSRLSTEYIQQYHQDSWAAAAQTFELKKRDWPDLVSWGCSPQRKTGFALPCKFFFKDLSTVDIACTPAGCTTDRTSYDSELWSFGWSRFDQKPYVKPDGD